MWREGERNRRLSVAGAYERELRSHEEWAQSGGTPRGQRYTWSTEAHIQTSHNVSSGAAAVMAKRRLTDGSPGGSQTTEAGSSQPSTPVRARRRARCDEGAVAAPTLAGGEVGPPDTGTMRRLGDGLLVYNMYTLQRLEGQLRTSYYWQCEP